MGNKGNRKISFLTLNIDFYFTAVKSSEVTWKKSRHDNPNQENKQEEEHRVAATSLALPIAQVPLISSPMNENC